MADYAAPALGRTLRSLCYKAAKAIHSNALHPCSGRPDLAGPTSHFVQPSDLMGPTSDNKEALMKFALLLSCALLLAGASAARADTRADIDTLEKDFNAAYAANDLDKYFGYYSDDAVLWFPDGRTDVPSYKKMWTAYIKSGAQLKSAELSDYHV